MRPLCSVNDVIVITSFNSQSNSNRCYLNPCSTGESRIPELSHWPRPAAGWAPDFQTPTSALSAAASSALKQALSEKHNINRKRPVYVNANTKGGKYGFNFICEPSDAVPILQMPEASVYRIPAQQHVLRTELRPPKSLELKL